MIGKSENNNQITDHSICNVNYFTIALSNPYINSMTWHINKSLINEIFYSSTTNPSHGLSTIYHMVIVF